VNLSGPSRAAVRNDSGAGNIPRRRSAMNWDQVEIFADFRWIFLDEPNVDNSQIEEEEFDYGQVTLGLGIKF
jgi:hypothetical protein